MQYCFSKFGKFFAVAAVVLSSLTASLEASCPFCEAVSQTLRQEIEAMDGAAFGKFVPADSKRPTEEGIGRFVVTEIIKGTELLKVGQVVEAPYFGTTGSETTFLLLGVDPPELMWSSPLPVTDRAAGLHSQNALVANGHDRATEVLYEVLRRRRHIAGPRCLR